MNKLHLLTLSLCACVIGPLAAQTIPQPGDIGFPVKNAGAGSTTAWVTPGTPPRLFGIKPDSTITAIDPGDNATINSSGVLEISGFIAADEYGEAVKTFLATPTSENLYEAMGDRTGSGLLVFEDSPTITTPTISGAITFADGVRQTFNPNGTNSGFNAGSHTADPSSLSNGDVWYNSTSNELKARINGASVALGASGGSGDVVGPGSSTDNTLPRFDGTSGKTIQASVVAIDDSGNINMADSTTLFRTGNGPFIAETNSPSGPSARWNGQYFEVIRYNGGNSAGIAASIFDIGAERDALLIRDSASVVKLTNGSTGYASLTTGSFSSVGANGTFSIVDSILDTTRSELYIGYSRAASINFLNGYVSMATNGTVLYNGPGAGFGISDRTLGGNTFYLYNDDGSFRFGTAGSDKMLIDTTSGNIGIGAASTSDKLAVNGVVAATSYRQGASGPTWSSGSGTPEGTITAPIGSTFSRTNGSTGTSLYVKESGSGNTGWVPVAAGGGGGTGDVTGPIASTDGQLVVFDGTTGKAIKGANFVWNGSTLAAGSGVPIISDSFNSPGEDSGTTYRNHAFDHFYGETGTLTIQGPASIIEGGYTWTFPSSPPVLGDSFMKSNTSGSHSYVVANYSEGVPTMEASIFGTGGSYGIRYWFNPEWPDSPEFGDSYVQLVADMASDEAAEIMLPRKSGRLLLAPNSFGTSGNTLTSNGDGTTSWTDAAKPPLTETFTTSGTWTKPAGAKKVHVYLVGGGGGGGSGRKAIDAIRCGGGGGAGGAVVEMWLDAAGLDSSESYTIGSGGAGGASQTTNTTNGLVGTAGNPTEFNGITALGGNPGAAGVAASGAGGATKTNSCIQGSVASNSSIGGAASTTGLAGVVGTLINYIVPTGGGAGGGIPASNALTSAGGGGGGMLPAIVGTLSGGTAGSAGNPGGDGPNRTGGSWAGGGGGGGSSTNAGGNGGLYGGGGGGGGAGTNDLYNSGAGGNGGGGVLVITTFF